MALALDWGEREEKTSRELNVRVGTDDAEAGHGTDEV